MSKVELDPSQRVENRSEFLFLIHIYTLNGILKEEEFSLKTIQHRQNQNNSSETTLQLALSQTGCKDRLSTLECIS